MQAHLSRHARMADPRLRDVLLIGAITDRMDFFAYGRNIFSGVQRSAL